MFTLPVNGGKMAVCYNFQDGNPITNVPARLTLDNKFAQELLENSPIFKRRVVTLERIITDEPQKKVTKELKHVKEVTNVAMAVDYIANTYGAKVKNTNQAVEFAKKHGFDFPNLKVKE